MPASKPGASAALGHAPLPDRTVDPVPILRTPLGRGEAVMTLPWPYGVLRGDAVDDLVESLGIELEDDQQLMVRVSTQ